MSTLRERDDIAAVNGPTDAQRQLLSKLATITEMIKQHRATIFMLERERMQVTTKLRLTGYRAPAAELPPLPTSGGHALP
jgi:hypothetical protein